MPLTVSYSIDSFSADLKTATLVDNSTYEGVNRYDYEVHVGGKHIRYDGIWGGPLNVTTEYNDPTYDQIYTIYLEQTPYNGDGWYQFDIDYENIVSPTTPPVITYNFNFLLTPKTEQEYANMLSEASEECCSVDFNIEKIKDLLFVGCFLDATFIIKDRLQQIGQIPVSDFFPVYLGERLIRRAQTIIE
jgi:hypothetical protein